MTSSLVKKLATMRKPVAGSGPEQISKGNEFKINNGISSNTFIELLKFIYSGKYFIYIYLFILF